MIRPSVLRVIVRLALIAQACAKEPVRTEPGRLRKKTGLGCVPNLSDSYRIAAARLNLRSDHFDVSLRTRCGPTSKTVPKPFAPPATVVP
jgi:hypothetical protein